MYRDNLLLSNNNMDINTSTQQLENNSDSSIKLMYWRQLQATCRKKQCFWLKNEDTDKAWKKCFDLNSGTKKMQCYNRSREGH